MDAQAIVDTKQGIMSAALNIAATGIKKLIGKPVQRCTGMGTAIKVGMDLFTLADNKGLLMLADTEATGGAILQFIHCADIHDGPK